MNYFCLDMIFEEVCYLVKKIIIIKSISFSLFSIEIISEKIEKREIQYGVSSFMTSTFSDSFEHEQEIAMDFNKI